MQFSNILVPFDGSDHARDALWVAAGFMDGAPDVSVHVLTVLDEADFVPQDFDSTGLSGAAPSMAFGPLQFQELFEASRKRAIAEATEAAQAVLGDLDALGGRIVIDAVAAPAPVDGIKSYVSDHGCDLVVMGRRGLGRIRSLLGSVSTSVLRELDIPVLTVK